MLRAAAAVDTVRQLPPLLLVVAAMPAVEAEGIIESYTW